MFLGIDASTQSMTGIVIDPDNIGKTIERSVNFQRDIPAYNTTSGAVRNPKNPLEVWSYPEMWLEALEMLMSSLSEATDLSKIRGIGGAGQQHASVWMSSPDFFADSANWEINSLHKNIKKYLSRERAPIWMDCSTAEECDEIEKAAGGRNIVLQTTGSIATERFTGAQIRKIFKRETSVYENTKRIHLNSSFLCSVLCGKDAPTERGDAAGMNLMDLSAADWDRNMLDATAPRLLGKLPHISENGKAIGTISPYFVRNYGFSPDAQVCVFTGDNPSSMVGAGASTAGNAVVSLGTSDTFFYSNSGIETAEGGHVFGNPSGGMINLVCFRNGSLAREAFIKEFGMDWNLFDNDSFENYKPSVSDKFIVPFYTDEISPKIASSEPKFFGMNKGGNSKSELAALFIEGQILNMYLCAQKIGAKASKILITGGASKSAALARCISDVFQVPVFRQKSQTDSAALGGAIIAAEKIGQYALSNLEKSFCDAEKVASPRRETAKIYSEKAARFSDILKSLQ